TPGGSRPAGCGPSNVGRRLRDPGDVLHPDDLAHPLDAQGVELVVEREGDELEGGDGRLGLGLLGLRHGLDESDDLIGILRIRLGEFLQQILGKAEGGKFLTHATSPLLAARPTRRSGARRRTTAPSARRAAPSTGAPSLSEGSRAWKTKSCWPSS